MANIITKRIYDFLKNHPPFSFMSEEELFSICHRIKVQYFADGEKVFSQGDTTSPMFYVINQGAIALFREEDNHRILVDSCDEGDIFGLRPLIADENYTLSAIAKEEVLVYAIPNDSFQSILVKNTKVSQYLTSSFAAGVRKPYSKNNKGRLFADNEQFSQEIDFSEVLSIERSKSPITCLVNTSVQEAAQIMAKENVGSIIIVDSNDCPLGIITDKDLRVHIATGNLPLHVGVEDIMSSPVICIDRETTVAHVQIKMINNKVHHLCMTVDGSPTTPVVGVVSEHDLLVVQANNPAVLVREASRASSGEELRFIRDKAELLLRKYLFKEVAISFISDVMTQINDSIIIQAIKIATNRLTQKGVQHMDTPFCWLALGSEGREEQLLRTDQDSAIIFEDVPNDQLSTIRNYFLSLAKETTDILNECGFEYCPADMMASNPRWCLSVSEWKEQFNRWIYSPGEKEIMYTTIFFDYRPIYGEMTLAKTMTDNIYETIGENDIFLSLLAKNALQNPPPLSFFRNFVVERSGEHKDEFDIKARAMMPLTDAARLLTIQAKQYGINNTFQRFDHMATLEGRNKELYEQAADAYEILMRFRALQGLKNGDSGRFFKPYELNKMQRMMLRNSFVPIKKIQDLISIRFRLKMLG